MARKDDVFQEMTKAIRACNVPEFHKSCIDWCVEMCTPAEIRDMEKRFKNGEICHKKPPQVTPS